MFPSNASHVRHDADEWDIDRIADRDSNAWRLLQAMTSSVARALQASAIAASAGPATH